MREHRRLELHEHLLSVGRLELRQPDQLHLARGIL